MSSPVGRSCAGSGPGSSWPTPGPVTQSSSVGGVVAEGATGSLLPFPCHGPARPLILGHLGSRLPSWAVLEWKDRGNEEVHAQDCPSVGTGALGQGPCRLRMGGGVCTASHFLLEGLRGPLPFKVARGFQARGWPPPLPSLRGPGVSFESADRQSGSPGGWDGGVPGARER